MPNESCGLLLTRRVLCSVDDQQEALQEIFRVLKPGKPVLRVHDKQDNSSCLLRSSCINKVDNPKRTRLCELWSHEMKTVMR